MQCIKVHFHCLSTISAARQLDQQNEVVRFAACSFVPLHGPRGTKQCPEYPRGSP